MMTGGCAEGRLTRRLTRAGNRAGWGAKVTHIVNHPAAPHQAVTKCGAAFTRTPPHTFQHPPACLQTARNLHNRASGTAPR